jgi:hypothetical protein
MKTVIATESTEVTEEDVNGRESRFSSSFCLCALCGSLEGIHGLGPNHGIEQENLDE